MINVEYDLPEYNRELNKELLKVFSKESTRLLMRFYLKYPDLDKERLEVFTDGDIIPSLFLVLSKLLNIGRIKSSSYLTEDRRYVSCTEGITNKIEEEIRKEYLFFFFKKFMNLTKAEEAVNNFKEENIIID